jgi:uncharacterized SAM-binding protein YcdF (DUF218 family)
VATHAEVSLTRLVAILGYSDGRASGMHPICEARLARAAEEATPDDVILFSGWARARSAEAEADLMAAAWTAPARSRLVDRGARTTLGNALGVAHAAQRFEADEVVLVTSSWHARRAATLVRAALAGSGTSVRVAPTSDVLSPRRGARELGAWLALPLLALLAVRNR